MLLIIVMAIFGIYALSKGEIKISNSRIVTGPNVKTIGILLLVGAGAPFLGFGIVSWPILIGVIIWGYILTND